MGGFFAVASKENCASDLFFGTDYHSHLGTQRGGMAVFSKGTIQRVIHDITNAQFRTKFDEDLPKFNGHTGIGVISDYDDQPVLVGSHLGTYAVVTVGVIQNLDDLVAHAFRHGRHHFVEMSGSTYNPTEVVAAIISQADSFVQGIERVQELVDGSCSLLLLTSDGVYAARDRYGRTSVVTGTRDGAYAVSMETSAFPNLDYETDRFLGPGEIVRMTPDGIEQLKAPGDEMQICTFLWVYYGYPASSYEGISTEETRYRCGAALARRDDVEVDMAAGIPDSGTAHAIGYANEARVPYMRPFVKYTPTWPRSFMPQNQEIRDLVARMKLIPVRSMVKDRRILFCEDSIVRGTQLRDIVQRLYDYGAKEVHMRPACPPLTFGCRYLNFSRSRSIMDLATRRAIKELEGNEESHLDEYSDPTTDRYNSMVDSIRHRLKLTTLKYQKLDDLVEAVGLPKCKLCTYCWDGCTGPCGSK
ncbi:MAG: amidophosphoribosyltransferase [Lentisphaeria bacterium]|nr:amidophosphoribosyltransferase [Lentisphaeria bacterium]